MKVAYITMQFPFPSEMFAANDVLSLRRQGVDISVHSLRPAHENTERMVEERGLSEIPITHNDLQASLKGIGLSFRYPNQAVDLLFWSARHNYRRPLHFLKSLVFFPRAIELFSRLRKENPDVVHLFWGHYPALVGYLAHRYIPNTRVTTFLGPYDLAMGYGVGEEMARQADAVWTHVRANVEVLLDLGISEEKLLVVYRGTDLNKIVEAPKVRRRLVSVGSLTHRKGMDDALRVFSHILPVWSDATFFVLGDGPERESLKALADELGVGHATTFLGHVNHDRVLQEMAEAEVFLLMSRNDKLPNVAKEAMASGCICIITATPGIEELVNDKENGFVVPVGDVAGAAHYLELVFSDEIDITRVAGKAKNHVRTYFDLDKSMHEYKTVWENLVDES